MDDNLNKNPELQNAQPEIQPVQEVVSQPTDAEQIQEAAPVQPETQPTQEVAVAPQTEVAPTRPEVTSQPAQTEATPQPTAPVQAAQPVTFAADPAPKKSKTPIIIAAVVGGLVLICGIVFAVIMLLQPKNFDAIVDKDVTCELSQGGLSMNIDGKFSKDKKLTMKINFLVSAETTADYEVISTEGNKTKLKITNAKTKAVGLDGKVTEQDSSSQTNGEMILDFENFSKDKTFKISSEQAATVGTALNCKLKN